MVLLNHVTEDGFEDISALMTDISEDDGGRQGINWSHTEAEIHIAR